MGARYSSEEVFSGLRRKSTRCTLGEMLKLMQQTSASAGNNPEQSSDLEHILSYNLQHLLHFYVLLFLDTKRAGILFRDDLQHFLDEYINGEKNFAQVRAEFLTKFVTPTAHEREYGSEAGYVEEAHVEHLLNFARGGRTMGADDCSVVHNNLLSAHELESLWRLLCRDGFEHCATLSEFLQACERDEAAVIAHSAHHDPGPSAAEGGHSNISGRAVHAEESYDDGPDDQEEPRIYCKHKVANFLRRYLQGIRSSFYFEHIRNSNYNCCSVIRFCTFELFVLLECAFLGGVFLAGRDYWLYSEEEIFSARVEHPLFVSEDHYVKEYWQPATTTQADRLKAIEDLLAAGVAAFNAIRLRVFLESANLIGHVRHGKQMPPRSKLVDRVNSFLPEPYAALFFGCRCDPKTTKCDGVDKRVAGRLVHKKLGVIVDVFGYGPVETERTWQRDLTAEAAVTKVRGRESGVRERFLQDENGVLELPQSQFSEVDFRAGQGEDTWYERIGDTHSDFTFPVSSLLPLRHDVFGRQATPVLIPNRPREWLAWEYGPCVLLGPHVWPWELQLNVRNPSLVFYAVFLCFLLAPLLLLLVDVEDRNDSGGANAFDAASSGPGSGAVGDHDYDTAFATSTNKKTDEPAAAAPSTTMALQTRTSRQRQMIKFAVAARGVDIAPKIATLLLFDNGVAVAALACTSLIHAVRHKFCGLQALVVLNWLTMALCFYETRNLAVQMWCHFEGQYIDVMRPKIWTLCLFGTCRDFT
eukprot:g5676.t1